ncbi:MAG TPA: molybdenum cofactor guanylyltransferase [Phycisphaerae bacterium]|nr:molybdenum cofactor guanylyltransferase [Phycisphaerae bacterium]HNU44956.1 molybdenum cofactor guanylyltransferase [Phycisphaerae bacterium]
MKAREHHSQTGGLPAGPVPRADDLGPAGILIGGRSTRMGCPKTLLRLPDGRTLIERTVALAAQVVAEVVLLGAGSALPPAVRDLTVLPDAEPDGGPIEGLISLLRHRPQAWCLLLACDLPQLSVPLLQRLLVAERSDAEAVVFRRDDRRHGYHACCALYHPRVLPAAMEERTAGKGSLHGLLHRLRLTALTPTPDETEQLANVNTPEDFARVCRSVAPTEGS